MESKTGQNGSQQAVNKQQKMGPTIDQESIPAVNSTISNTLDIADTGVGDGKATDTSEDVARKKAQLKKDVSMTTILVPRPQLRRNVSSIQPPQQPLPAPAPAPEQPPAGAPDSLSLLQLRRLITDMPKWEPTAYAFTYDDADSFSQELEEWFSYPDQQRSALLKAREVFELKWKGFIKDELSGNLESAGWTGVDDAARKKFVGKEVAGLKSFDFRSRELSLEALLYVALGVWGETARSKPGREDRVDSQPMQNAPSSQADWILKNAMVIQECGALDAVYNVLKESCLQEWDDVLANTAAGPNKKEEEVLMLANSLTLMYVLVEVARQQVKSGEGSSLRDALVALEPSYLIFLVKTIARLRWDDSVDLPLAKILSLFWKSVLVIFGGTKELNETKAATRVDQFRTSDDEAKMLITASPLDYHLFRQEITSKYPAYNPPPPVLPLESDSSSILPPLPAQPGKSGASRSGTGIGPSLQSNNGSILNQPVHIATPAPSPPPSPVGPGGKAGKKQNYQTNQNFPFLYPPLDASAGDMFGNFDFQAHNFRSSRGEGSDVPASILEAGELFAGRVRMTRALRQLWDERERFMKFERGWTSVDGRIESETASAEESVEPEVDKTDAAVKKRLDMVEDFYRQCLPHLQSLVIVLLKVVLANVTVLVTQPSQGFGQNGPSSSLYQQDHPNTNGQAQSKGRDQEARAQDGSSDGEKNEGRVRQMTVEEVESTRCREITAKAVSGVLLLLLKWFKVSHVLKFEFLTQLLLDSNYLPLILKLFAHQEPEKVVDSVIDRDELGFFEFCKNRSSESPKGTAPEPDEEDDACPPPVIKRHRLVEREPSSQTNTPQVPPPEESRAAEVDELGCQIPSEPITSFSWRNFFSNINFLRTMQKICKHKAHRNLLLVQYKSSTILKKSLKVPQPELRLYTLKLFKNQVPYCGRKWRQTNMRVITAVYLHCRPELRDDWLAGSDVDAEVEEALPLEQALRALTHWHNVKRYPEQMGVEAGVLEEGEQDFFVRELERMDFGGEDGSAVEETNRDGLWDGPLQAEGW